MTLPSLIQKQNEKATITAVKKAYTIFSQAFLLAQNEHGTPENWNLGIAQSKEGANRLLDILSPYLKIVKNCHTDEGCINENNFKNLQGTNADFDFTNELSSKAILADGTSIMLYLFSPSCDDVVGSTKELQNVCGTIFINLEQVSKQNRLGITSFRFLITKYGIYPSGMSSTNDGNKTFERSCNLASTYLNNGYGCTAWVIANENMDYLHCNDLSWSGKTKCK